MFGLYVIFCLLRSDFVEKLITIQSLWYNTTKSPICLLLPPEREHQGVGHYLLTSLGSLSGWVLYP